MNDTAKSERRLRLACEFTGDSIVAARASDGHEAVESCVVRTLPAGAVTPALTAANISNVGAVVTAATDALNGVNGRHRDVIAVIPDAACRVALLDFDELPDKPQDIDSVVRFRLKKYLPFDVDRAQLAYDVRRSKGSIRVLAAVSLLSVVQEYESVLRSAGYSPGVVMPSTLAALQLVDGSRPTLVVKVAPGAMSVVILNNDDVLLFRTVESNTSALDPAQLADEIYPSLVFFQDTYGMKVERVLLGGVPNTREFAPALEGAAGVKIQELVSSSLVSSDANASAHRPTLGGILGALIS
jgi:type IV pilus assembly protein PilM